MRAMAPSRAARSLASSAPARVSHRTSAASRPGCRAAKASAAYPPIDIPSTAARGTSSWSSTAATSSAPPAMASPPSVSGVSPKPRPSTAITRCRGERASLTLAQIRRSKGNGCSSTTGDPAPRTSYPTGPSEVAPEVSMRASKLAHRPQGLQHQRYRAGGPCPDLEGARDERRGGGGPGRVVVVERAERVAPRDRAPDLGVEHEGGAGRDGVLLAQPPRPQQRRRAPQRARV